MKTNNIQYGVSGFLAPNGTFHSCGYMEHSKLAQEIVELYKITFEDSNRIDGFIKFGCTPWVKKEGNGMCHVFSNAQPTPEQVEWIHDNKHLMTDIQRRQAMREILDWEK